MVKNLRIEILSYWHAGSGMGQGSELDATVIRDVDGLPYLPGRTLKGLIREALLTCEELEQIEKTTAKRLCGIPKGQPGSLFISNATLPPEEGAWLGSEEGAACLPGLYDRFTSTQLTKDGIAKGPSLRTIELCVPLILFSEIEIDPTEEKDQRNISKDWLAIKRACTLIRAVGAHRTRGLGRCIINLED